MSVKQGSMMKTRREDAGERHEYRGFPDILMFVSALYCVNLGKGPLGSDPTDIQLDERRCRRVWTFSSQHRSMALQQSEVHWRNEVWTKIWAEGAVCTWRKAR